MPGLTCLDQQRHVVHHHVVACGHRRRLLDGGRLADERMHDAVQARQRRLVAEDTGSQGAAVQLPEHVDDVAELRHDGGEPRRSGSHHRTREDVVVDHSRTELPQSRSHRGLARGDAPRQADAQRSRTVVRLFLVDRHRTSVGRITAAGAALPGTTKGPVRHGPGPSSSAQLPVSFSRSAASASSDASVPVASLSPDEE